MYQGNFPRDDGCWFRGRGGRGLSSVGVVTVARHGTSDI